MCTKAKGDRLKVVDLVAGIEYVVRCVLGCAAHRTHQVPRTCWICRQVNSASNANEGV